MEQLLCHLVGDYILQSHTMAVKKKGSSFWATYHGIVYSLPFIFIASPNALFVIAFTHVIIDYLSLANYVTSFKNFFFGTFDAKCLKEVYPEQTPLYLTVWLVILMDQTIHLVINYFAIKYL